MNFELTSNGQSDYWSRNRTNSHEKISFSSMATSDAREWECRYSKCINFEIIHTFVFSSANYPLMTHCTLYICTLYNVHVLDGHSIGNGASQIHKSNLCNTITISIWCKNHSIILKRNAFDFRNCTPNAWNLFWSQNFINSFECELMLIMHRLLCK